MLSGGVFEYAAINARARAMYFTLLTAQEWIELVNATDYNALIGLLRRTIYGSCLMQVDEKDLDPRQTVFQLNRQMADVYVTVIQSAPEHTRPLLTLLYRDFEVDNLS